VTPILRRLDLTQTDCLDNLRLLPEWQLQLEENAMTDPPRHPGTDGNGGPGPEGPGGASRWRVVLGVTIAIALLVLIVLLHATGTIGPGAH
jgi:hypothetical protein